MLKKAQAEIDAIVGLNHLPDFHDFDSLPFITAIVKETMRWRDIVPIGELIFSLKVIELNPGVPLAVPHLLTTDDAYKGYRLPAGSIVIPNAWLVINTLNIVVHDRRSSGNQGHAS